MGNVSSVFVNYLFLFVVSCSVSNKIDGRTLDGLTSL